MTGGFREIRHTADWALEVWAPYMPGLLTQAALGMNWLMGVELALEGRIEYRITLKAVDFETLLVAFLNEILFEMEANSIGFDTFDITISDFNLEARLIGASLQGLNKSIKAVTYHNIQILQTREGFKTTIVFDV